MNIGRIVTAMVTPFNEQDQVNLEATCQLVNELIANGSDALVVGGTTGESPTLTTDEKMALFHTVVEAAGGRVPVIAGTGSNNTRASIELSKKVEDLGVDGIMLVTPYYNKPSQEGLFQHFKAISESTSLPIMLYNIPGRSGVNLDAETTLRLAELRNIVSIKEASGNLDQIAEIIEHSPADFSVYSGDDSLTLPLLSIGGTGVVSVASHIIGNEMQEMVQLFLSGQVERAAAIHRKLLPLMKTLFMTPNPTAVKAALELKGLPVGHVRLPLVPLTAEEQRQLELAINPQFNMFVS
ncbi:4-hydroxy-tetrahydrodipicolinate synthase [Halalkalibacterium halodurans]|uniref:4-hydroxy-tetrahydrodipicolinate synthase 1 n=2 Tax=Halalkalibacterium halodurans TaxID=86665 RepID=DAPA1_HALH5|nr:4-hydroxy-tetrahydrodipicolinate synthase [Halalkalibacterium halodurans]Q9KC32.1 RecName: Full=4-hydroxy-tetrahydrodipicolinate synthase 1; Short=HTPA synthase 1 [Halalkalibacterium halodurans C-125]MDY7222310.1 4-hydroxy-tetrahydrodipicolinate synthase [Halalkalibacterium halodurans]MDY7241531.1 4-hydroxy-tetrahydrodipicolinate synthase [Halalkalibacterium halodurans]MED3646007.1 4-hydroxy-tetrahydrodipicolinate synthase [Halalkalibacterium halodurans]MED4082386.1 4-hydroxy-tetrahydrodipi